jgi:phage tail-like protein
MTQASEISGVVSLVPRKPESNGHGPPMVIEEEEIAASSLLKYLPAIYSGDPFVGRFLRIFEDVLTPVQVMVDNQPYYFDPLTAPKDLLDWLAFWVDLDEGRDWPMPKRRALVTAAPVLYRMRGTKAGLKKHLGIYAGAANLTLINERTNGFRLDPDSRLGVNTSIGVEREHVFTVTIAVPDPDELDIDTLKSILDADKPIETSYILHVVGMGV